MNPHARSDLRFSAKLIFFFTRLFYNKSLINRKNARHSGFDQRARYLSDDVVSITACSASNIFAVSLPSILTPTQTSWAKNRSPPVKQPRSYVPHS